jgi:transcriptional antiterminator NusG
MQDQILGSNIPVETVEEIQEGGKRKTFERKLFPGYVFVKIAVDFDNDDQPTISDESWWVVRNIRGVTGFVGPDNKPAPLDEEKVIEMGVEKRSIESNVKVGDLVNITHPNFESFTGRVESVNPEMNIAKVSITGMFGKETILDLGLEYIDKIS